MKAAKHIDPLLSFRNLKQIKSWRSFVIILGGFAIGIILDAIVKCTGFAFVYVSDDYINETFGATCTVAVLGNAILSLLVGASEREIKGIPFQDIMQLTKFGSDQRITIVATTFSIILAIVAYSLDLCTTVTFVAWLDAILIISSSIDLWEILSNEEKQLEIINEIIDNEEPHRADVYVENWFEALSKSLDSYNESTIDEFCTLISKISATSTPEEHPINSAIARYLPKLFEIGCEKVGFVDAYKLIRKINKTRPDGFIDCETTATDYIKALKYCNGINVHNRSIPTVIEMIIGETEFEDWAKSSFVYHFFSAVYDNSFLTSDAKNDMLVDALNVLTYLRDDNAGEVKKEVIHYIIKFDILLNDNDGRRTTLFHIITELLLRNNLYADDRIFIATISEIFRAFYFYIYCEKETLTEEYRKCLLKLYLSQQNNRDLIVLSFNYLVREYYEDIVPWLAQDAMTFDHRKRIRWDYFGPTTRAKKMVWSSDEVIRFAYCFYKLVGYIRSDNPFIEIVDSNNLDENEKIALCRIITDLYDDGVLNDYAKVMIQQMAELTGIQIHYSSYRDKPEYSFFQEKLSELLSKNNQEVVEAGSPTNEEILELVKKELEKGDVFVFDTELQMKPAMRRKIEPILIERNKHSTENTAYRIAQIAKRLMNDVISRKLRIIPVSFGLKGVASLIENLGEQEYLYRNYTHVNDLAIPTEVKSTDEYRRLCDIIAEIKYDSSREIIPHVFLKSDKVPYRITIKYNLENPTEEECADYIKRHQISEGTYQISSNRFDFSHAMQFVRKNYRVENVEISLRVKINSNSGFQIKIERSKE